LTSKRLCLIIESKPKQKTKRLRKMAAQTPINELLQKRMDRKDFLKHVALGMAVLTGTASVIKLFRPQQTGSGPGYGASAYGGVKPPQQGR
jgi:hypothetical protein